MAEAKETATAYVPDSTAVTVVSQRGQTQIPVPLCRKFGIRPQTKLRWIDTGKTIVIMPIPDQPIKAARGMLKGKRTTVAAYLAAKHEELAQEDQKLKGNVE